MSLIALLLVLAGCGGQSDRQNAGRADPDGTIGPSTVTCHANYRPDADTTAGAQDEQITVEPSAGVAEDGGDRLEFERLSLEVRYLAAPTESDAVKLFVYDPDDEPVSETLYQLGTPGLAEIRFSGGHGFTGLHYIHHEGALLQVWCTAEQ